MRVLLDVDGVCADFVDRARDYVPSLPDQLISYDLSSQCIKADAYRLECALSTVEFWSELSPIYLAVAGVSQMRNDGCEVFFVTSPLYECDGWLTARMAFLQEYFDAKEQDVVFAQSKHLIAGDCFVDDKPSNVHAWQMANPHKHGMLYGADYNSASKLPRFSWYEYLQKPDAAFRTLYLL